MNVKKSCKKKSMLPCMVLHDVQQPSDINGTGRIVTTVIALKESDLYFVKLVKKAHKHFQRVYRFT